MGDIKIKNTKIPEEASKELLEKTLIDNGKLTIPVDVVKIAEMIGIKVMILPLEKGTDGLLVKKENEPFVAVVDSASNPHRARFTLAHEIGHYIKDYQDFPIDESAGLVEKRDELSSAGVDSKEIWANQFAASLLMPAAAVKSLWASNKTIERMASLMNVSIASLGHRLDYLGLH